MRTQKMTGVALAGIALATLVAVPVHAQQTIKVQIQNGRKSTKNTTTKRVANTTTRTSGYNRSRRYVPNVTMNLRNAPVRTALMQLFQKAHRDYSLDNDVSGVVNMRITNKPFTQALQLIAENATVPLTYNVDSGVYFIRPVRTRAVRTTQPVIAEQTEDTTNQPQNAAQVARAATPVTPPVNYLGNFNGFATPGYPAFSQPGYGGAFPVYTVPTAIGTPLFPQVNGFFGNSMGWPNGGVTTYYGGGMNNGTYITLP